MKNNNRAIQIPPQRVSAFLSLLVNEQGAYEV
jgi:hypothetical protein